MCTIFSYKTEDGKIIIGRNFDWIQRGGRVHIKPPSRAYGLKINGTIVIEQIGEDRPYDGMNDKGLFVGMAAVCNSEIKSGFKDMNNLGLIKYILERASTAEEALYIAKKHDLYYMDDLGYPKVHYMFADKNSNVVIYEEGKIEKCIRLGINEGEVITNFAYYDMLPCDRNDKVKKHFNNKIKDHIEVRNILEEVQQEEVPEYSSVATIYSAIYDLEEGFLKLWVEKDYTHEHRFYIDEVKKGENSVDFGELRLRAEMNKNTW